MAFFSARLRIYGQDFGRLFGDGHGAALAFAVDPVRVRGVDLHEDFRAAAILQVCLHAVAKVNVRVTTASP